MIGVAISRVPEMAGEWTRQIPAVRQALRMYLRTFVRNEPIYGYYAILWPPLSPRAGRGPVFVLFMGRFQCDTGLTFGAMRE